MQLVSDIQNMQDLIFHTGFCVEIEGKRSTCDQCAIVENAQMSM